MASSSTRAAEGPGREERDRLLRPGRGRAYAALDLGTNNCRLLIARPAHRGFRVVDSFSRIVRLGEGLAATGDLSAAAIERCLAALALCAEKIRRQGAPRVRCVATEACRRAASGDAFVARVRAETGLVLETISAREEARLALVGCAPLLDPALPRALVIDIGGGSTELMWLRLERGREPSLVGISSLPIGVVTMAERYGGVRSDHAIFAAMMAEVGERLGAFEAIYRIRHEIAAGKVQMLATSGTVTTLAGIHLGLDCYDRQRIDGTTLTFEAALDACRRLVAMSPEERSLHPCIGPDRAEFVIAGCAIFEAVRATWPVGRLVVADRGLREGILLSMMREDRQRRGRGGVPPRAAPTAAAPPA
ncbi:MAG: Ppx/GppA family phosphatase [Proteobacteria bacterium]|nr:Ppx/GppA family phosphatase [Pseudomonadota bacterium]